MSRLSSSLSTKLFLGMAPVPIAIFALIGVLDYLRVREAAYAEVEHACKGISQAFEEVLVEHPHLLNREKLQPVLYRFVAKIPAVTRMQVIDYAGRTIAQATFGSRVDSATGAIANLPKIPREEMRHSHAGRDLLQFINPVPGPYDPARQSQLAAYLIVEADLAGAELKARNTALVHVLVLASLFALVFIGNMWLLRGLVVRPVEVLSALTRRFGQGELSVRSEVSSTDEVGRLATDFNQMADQIQHATQELRRARDQLDQRVREQTNELIRANEALVGEIAERTRAEELVRKSKEELHRLISASPAVIYSLKFEHGELAPTWIGDNLLHLTGHQAGDIFAPNWWVDRLHPDDRERVLAEHALPFQKNHLLTEYRFQHRDGSYVWIRDEKSLVRDAAGQPVEVVGSWADITASKKAVQELHHIFTLSQDLLCIAGFDGYFKRLNPAWQRLLGWPTEELLARPFLTIIHPEDAEKTTAAVQKLAQGNEAALVELRMLGKDGSYRSVLWNGNPIRGGPQFYAAGRDITALKQADAALQELNRRLVDASRAAGMAVVATSVLHNVGNVLNSVNVSADRVVEKINRLSPASLAPVAALLREHAHELPEFMAHNPQGKELPGYLLALIEQLATPHKDLVPELASLKKNVEHIREIVSMQQSYAQVSGVVESLSLPELVEDAIRINAAGLARHQVQLIRQYAPLPAVPLDKHKVLQILVNLLSNAKYALEARGEPERRLTLRVGSNGNGRIAISVIDNGIGIPPENLTRIFQHGFTTRSGGHGFGLHSGALAAREMGGSLTAHSEGVGKGAVFTLELPLRN